MGNKEIKDAIFKESQDAAIENINNQCKKTEKPNVSNKEKAEIEKLECEQGNFSTEDAAILYKLILCPGINIESDVYGDWFIATVWETDISELADTPIKAAMMAYREWKDNKQ